MTFICCLLQSFALSAYAVFEPHLSSRPTQTVRVLRTEREECKRRPCDE